MRKIRDNLSFQEVSERSEQILQRFWSLPEIQKTPQIFVYLSFRHEPDTFSLIRQALSLKKEILVPKVHGNDMNLCELSSLDSLQTGIFGISEPSSAAEGFLKDQGICVIPGLVFDRSGNRLGYGKGYYDRFLSNRQNLKIALAYSFQVISQIEVKIHDIPVDIILTETETIVCGERHEL